MTEFPGRFGIRTNKFKDEGHLNQVFTGSFASGEIKVAIMLAILAGASYLKLLVISTRHVQKTFHVVIHEWFLENHTINIDGIRYCKNEKDDFIKMGFDTGQMGYSLVAF